MAKKYNWGDGKGKVHSRAKLNRTPAPHPTSSHPQPTSVPAKPHPLLNQARDAGRVQYGAQLQDLQSQIGQSDQRQANISGWFQTYLARLGEARQASQAAVQQMTGMPSPQAVPSSGTPEAAAASQTLNSSQDLFQKTIAQQNQNNANVFNQQYANSGLIEAGAHMDETKARAQLQAQLRGVKGDQGAYVNDYRQKLKQQKFQNKLDKQHIANEAAIAGANNDFKVNKDNQTVYTTGAYIGKTHQWVRNHPKAADNMLTAFTKAKKNKGKGANNTPYSSGALTGKTPQWVRKHPNEAQQLTNDYNKLVHPPKDGPKKNKLTAAAIRRNQNDFRKALNAARQAPGKKDKKRGKQNAGQADGFVNTLTIGYNTPYDVATIVDYWSKHHGSITPQMYQKLHKLGIPEGWLKGHVKG